jgi:hypothetical protein
MSENETPEVKAVPEPTPVETPVAHLNPDVPPATAAKALLVIPQPRVSFWKRLKPQHYALIIAAFVVGFYGASVRHTVKPVVITPIPSITVTPTFTPTATPSATITPAKNLPIIAPKPTKGADALIPSKR